jgi:peptide/nickel transport system permease protein
MLMVGARTSIAVALVAVGIGMGSACRWGCWPPPRGGWLDEIIMRGNDLVFAFPSLVIAILITASSALGASTRSSPSASSTSPSSPASPAARRCRCGRATSCWRRGWRARAGADLVEHILPNIANLLIVQGTIQFSLGILAEAGLSYVGLGAQPPTPSWGRMLAEAQTMISLAPHVAIFPGSPSC